MKLEKMSVEEMIGIATNSDDLFQEQIDARKELLSRFSAQAAEIERLNAEAENGRCCGNCTLCRSDQCHKQTKQVSVGINKLLSYWKKPHEYCVGWQSDNLTRKEREG